MKTIKIKIKTKKPRVGHQANTHQVHEDKRTKRNRTRLAKLQKILKEYS
jgi:hypothetical protein